MPRKSRRVGILALSVAIAFAGLNGGCSASAEQGRRSARRATTPVAPSRAAPDVTGTLKSPPPTPAMPVTPAIKKDEDDEGPLKPFDLPTAPRARMRQCGENWQKIKMTGQVADRTWREFATACLKERDAKPQNSPRDVSSNASR